jgi:RNA polymerase sigma-70 factor (ECF subfamily)
MAPRVDPSDVVQEALLDAHRKMSEYLRERPVPFYPWLRRIAWERLVNLQLKHIHAEKRSVRRETPDALGLSNRSAAALAMRLVARDTSPSGNLIRKELIERVRRAMEELSDRDREVLILRHLEQLSIDEIAAVMDMSPGAVKVCRLRALERLRARLSESSGDSVPSRGGRP